MPETKNEPNPEVKESKPVPKSAKSNRSKKHVREFPLATISRIAKRHGAERVGEDAAVLLAEIGESYIASLVKTAMTYAKVAGRKTLKKEDLDIVLKQKGD